MKKLSETHSVLLAKVQLGLQVLDANVFVTVPQPAEEQKAADTPNAKHCNQNQKAD